MSTKPTLKKMAGELEDYVKKLEEEFVEFVEGFVMEPGQAYSIDGQDVRKLEFTDEIHNAFNIFDELEKKATESNSSESKPDSIKPEPPSVTKAAMPEQPKPNAVQQEPIKVKQPKSDDMDDEFGEKDDLDKEIEDF